VMRVARVWVYERVGVWAYECMSMHVNMCTCEV
jgi:hypothetical protein